MTVTFSLNRTCAPHYTLPEFLALARKVGVQAVELRNDIEGREFADGMSARDLKSRLADAGLKLASVNALQRFNDPTPARLEEARRLIAYTAELGAPGLVLCPAHQPGDDQKADAFARLCEGLSALQAMLSQAGVIGYVEPLGMRHSTLNRQAQAVAALKAIGAGPEFELCYDTFQHFRSGDDDLFADLIGLVHISGIARRDLGPGDLTEPDRGLVFPGDRVGNIDRLRRLADSGYHGFVSIEPFSPETQTDPHLAERLQESLHYVKVASGPD